MYTALTIAGSDSCAGAGIQADIKTMTALGVYATSCITALTAQNTTGVYEIVEVKEGFLQKQLDCVFTDIYPDAVKIGMIPNASLMRVIADRLAFYKAKQIVVDPVMISTSGHMLMEEAAIETLKTSLLSQNVVTTPNRFEAQVLAEQTIQSRQDMETAAKKIHETFGCTVLIKGGHFEEMENLEGEEGKLLAPDYLYGDHISRWYETKRIENPNTHGTGCTLSSAIAAYLAKGNGMEDAVYLAKKYLQGAIEANLNLGKGHGPLNHMWNQT